MKKYVGAALVAAFVFAGAACSDDGDSGASDITKEDFVEQANAVCEAGNDELDAVPDPTSEEEVVELITDTLIPNIRGQISDIRAIGFPEADAEQLDGIFDEAESVLDDIEDDPESFVTASADPFAEVNQDMNAYGLAECGGS